MRDDIKRCIARGIPPCNTPYVSTDTPTQQNLVVTPAQMAEMVERGEPVSVQPSIAEPINDLGRKDFDIAVEYQRGASLASVYQAEQSAKAKLRDYEHNWRMQNELTPNLINNG